MVAVIVVAAVVVLAALALVLLYNRLVRLRNRTQNAWSQVDVQLRRRHDLVPNLVETVQGYASHERGVFEDVTRARGAAQAADGTREQGAAEQGLSNALGRLMAVAEAYPQLRATENFQLLQGQLGETENRIAVARQVFNDTVQTYAFDGSFSGGYREIPLRDGGAVPGPGQGGEASLHRRRLGRAGLLGRSGHVRAQAPRPP